MVSARSSAPVSSPPYISELATSPHSACSSHCLLLFSLLTFYLTPDPTMAIATGHRHNLAPSAHFSSISRPAASPAGDRVRATVEATTIYSCTMHAECLDGLLIGAICLQTSQRWPLNHFSRSIGTRSAQHGILSAAGGPMPTRPASLEGAIWLGCLLGYFSPTASL